MEGWSHGGMESWRGSHRSLYGDACGRLKDYVTSEAVSGGRKRKGRQLDRFDRALPWAGRIYSSYDFFLLAANFGG
jgi:hypothetical protein